MEPIYNQMPTPSPLPKNKIGLWILLIIIVAILSGGGVYYWQSLEAKKQSQTAAEKVRAEMQNKLNATEDKIIELTNKLSETENKLTELDKNQTIDNLCTAAPTPTEAGYSIYPIDTKYESLRHLGELFTAADCNNPERLSKIFGVSGENYTLGATLTLTGKPSAGLLTELKKIGFTCNTKDTENNCLQWRLNKTVKVNNLTPLKQYYEELGGSDCVNCG